MIKLQTPLLYQHLTLGKVCIINQWIWENKNSKWYGPKGHEGIDIRTQGTKKYRRYNVDGKQGFREEPREYWEQRGRVPILACHAGTLRTVLYDNKQGLGWGIWVTTDIMEEGGQNVQYRSLYWHIETPWNSLSFFKGKVEAIQQLKALFDNKKVKAGSIIAIGGHNGMSSGPHLHLRFERRVMINGVWQGWEVINPMPHFTTKYVIFERTYYHIEKHRYTHEYWYNGEYFEDDPERARAIKKSIAVTHN